MDQIQNHNLIKKTKSFHDHNIPPLMRLHVVQAWASHLLAFLPFLIHLTVSSLTFLVLLLRMPVLVILSHLTTVEPCSKKVYCVVCLAHADFGTPVVLFQGFVFATSSCWSGRGSFMHPATYSRTHCCQQIMCEIISCTDWMNGCDTIVFWAWIALSICLSLVPNVWLVLPWK